MASGFLVLPDGRCLARRWRAYDEVLRAVAAQLGQEPPAQQLKLWLLEQLPGANDEEEIGYGAWVRASDQEVVARHIDLRGMTAGNQRLFCQAAKRAALTGHHEEGILVCLNDLAEMIVRGERGEHPLSKSDWIRVVPATGGLVGPGWVAIIRNRKVQFGGEEHLGWLPEGAAIPAPTPPEIVTLDFEIQAADGGYLLIWQGTERRHCGDTWHASVDAAMEQAKVWFGIEPQEWSSP